MKRLKLIRPKNIPNDSDFLWKYIDIHKFLDLLIAKRFRFTRMDQFEDSLEGIPFESLYRISAMKRELNVGFSDIVKTVSDFADKSTDKLYGRIDVINHIQASTYVSCWFLENRESMAMWNLYSNKDGVAVKVNFGKLKALLYPNIDDEFIKEYYCGRVVYQDLYESNPISQEYLRTIPKAALRKDKSFTHEKEFRFVIKLDNVDNELLGIDSQIIELKDLEMTIICHPQMPDWKKNNIKGILKSKKMQSSFKESGIELR